MCPFLGEGYTKHLEQSLRILCDKFCAATNAEVPEDVNTWAAQGQIPSRFLKMFIRNSFTSIHIFVSNLLNMKKCDFFR